MQKGILFLALFLVACNPFGESALIPDGRVVALTPQGQKNFEKEWRESKRHGTWRDYENNQLVAEYSYIRGVRDGDWKTWYPNGNQKTQVTYREDRQDGEQFGWYENGKRSLEGHFKDGKKHGVFRTFDTSGVMVEQKMWEEDELKK